MIAEWIYEENLRPFLTALGWVVGYPFDPDDWLAISRGVKESDGDADRWYEYEFYGRDTARFRLAQNPGSAVVQIQLEVPTAIDPQINLLLAVFQTFNVRDQQAPFRTLDSGEERR